MDPKLVLRNCDFVKIIVAEFLFKNFFFYIKQIFMSFGYILQF